MRRESCATCSLRGHNLLQLQSILQAISAEQDCSKVHLQTQEHLWDQCEDEEELSILQVKLALRANEAKNSLIKKDLIHEDENRNHIFIINRKFLIYSAELAHMADMISFLTCPIQNSKDV